MSSTTPNPPKPPGVIPQKLQTWLVLGITGAVVMIMMLSGSCKQRPPAKRRATADNEIQVAVEDVSDRMNELNRVAKKAGAAPAAPPEFVNQRQSAEKTRSLERQLENERQERRAGGGAGDREALERLRKSRLASSIAQGPRELGQGPAGTGSRRRVAMESGGAAESAMELPPPEVIEAMDKLGMAIPDSLRKRVAEAAKDGRNRRGSTNGRNRARGREYLVFEGSVLEAVLLTRLDGEFTGPVKAMVTTDYYSRDRLHVLIPAGTVAIGEAAKVKDQNQSRLAIAFHRFLMPDGFSVDLDQYTALNAAGDNALSGNVHRHYGRIFGAAAVLGMLGGVANVGTTGTGFDGFRAGVGASMANSGQKVLEQFSNVMPTITVKEGHRMRIYIGGDLMLPDYEDHQMPANL